jgi:hypothetical protein
MLWTVHDLDRMFPTKSFWTAINKMPSLQHLALYFDAEDECVSVGGWVFHAVRTINLAPTLTNAKFTQTYSDQGDKIAQFLWVLRRKFENNKALKNLKGLESFRVTAPWTPKRRGHFWQYLEEEHPEAREAQVAFDKLITEIETNLRAKYYSSARV